MIRRLCSVCQKEKPDSEMYWEKDGTYTNSCKLCKKSYKHDYYIKNKTRHQRNVRGRVKDLREWIKSLKVRGCSECGETHIGCMEFHHKSQKQKELEISKAISHGWSKKRIEAEVNKCDLLCANCHRKKHWSPEGNRIS